MTLKQAEVVLIDCVHKTPAALTLGRPYVGIPQMKDGRIVYESARKISETDYAEWRQKAKPQEHDIVLSRRTNPGVTAVVTREKTDFALGQNLVLLRSVGDTVYPPFLKWLTRTPEWWAEIERFNNVGAVFDSLKCRDVPNFELTVPDFKSQKDITNILSALDDKIELNRRTNETMEAMGQALFRDWFVDFGPVRRKMAGASEPDEILGGLIQNPDEAANLAALFPDALGDDGLPEGWIERTIEDDFDVVMGQSPPGDTYNETGEGFPFFQGRRDFGWRFPSRRVFCDQPKRKADADWTLVSVRAPVGDINRAWEECCIGRGVGAFMHRLQFASFSYYTGLHLREMLASYDNDGTVFGSINQKQFKGLALVGANTDAAVAFDEAVKPIDDLIRIRSSENKSLAQTRDYLLPKLMSGQVRAGVVEVA